MNRPDLKPPADLALGDWPEPEIPVLQERVLARSNSMEVVELRRLDQVDAIRFERRIRQGAVELLVGQTASPSRAAEWIEDLQTSAPGAGEESSA